MNTATNSNGKTKESLPISEYVTFRVVRKDVHVNPADNARKTYDPKRLEELAESIRTVGLEQPPLVRPATPADKTDKPWVLYAGFRRMRALDLLKWDSFDVRRPAGDRDAKALHLASLAENLARDNLSPYETAAGCDRVVTEYKASENEVAGATGISRSHVNNLLRCFRKLPPDALAAWANRGPEGQPHPAHKLATMDRLMKVAALETEPERATLWDEIVKGVPAAAPGAGTEAPGQTAVQNGNAGKAPSARVVTGRVRSALAFANSKAGKDYAPPATSEWFGAFVRYLAGYRTTPPEGMGEALEPKKEEPKKGGKKTKRAKRTARQ